MQQILEIILVYSSHGNQKLRVRYLKPSDLDSKKNTHFYSIIHKTLLTTGYKNFDFMKLIKKLSVWQVIMWLLLSDDLGHFIIIANSMHLWNKTFWSHWAFCSHGGWHIINTIEQRSAQGGSFVMLYTHLVRKGHFYN